MAISAFTAFIAGAGYTYLATNPKARNMALKQAKKLSGMAIDGLNKRQPEPKQNNEKEENLNAE